MRALRSTRSLPSARAIVACVAVAASACLVGDVRAQQKPRAPLWSDQPIARPAVPQVRDASWQQNAIDAFVLARLEARGMQPSPAASRAAWLRRASLDLTGLPPSPEDVDAFENDHEPGAFERAADRLLASVAYAERQAQQWLDIARYADSQGYEKDALRTSMWRWRDWVVDAFRKDMPFDQFTVEQLAGDLLPDATVEQRIATAMHRNTMTNTEGGTDDEEFRAAAVVDRVNTTMSAWMGATAGCAQCHDHKYDAISHREYFGLYAIFDQTADRDRADEAPVLRAPTAEQSKRIAAIEGKLAEVQRAIDALPRAVWIDEQRARLEQFARAEPKLSPWRVAGPFAEEDFDAAFARAKGLAEPPAADAGFVGNGWLDRNELTDGVVHPLPGERSSHFLRRTITCKEPCNAVLALGSDDAIVASIDGALVHANKASRAARLGDDLVEVQLAAGEHELLLFVLNGSGPGGFCFELRATRLDAATGRAVVAADADRNEAVVDAFAAASPEAASLRAQRDTLRAELAAIPVPSVPVLQELPADRRRTTRVHRRGSFLDQGDVVEPSTPACWPPIAEGAVRDRLAFARWLCDPRNPRTARVLANRAWESLFGSGLVATSEDFGVQGDLPSHPELLDWLACELRDGGWSWKQLLRSLVLSATYRQGSQASPKSRAIDPQNKLFSRSPRLRLSAEMLRDQALFVSGLLSRKVGGPSVMPAQPDGIWGQIYSGERWVTSDGGDRHRRSLYTLWRRTSPHPTMTTFDAPSREFCVVRRTPTNTPLQALALWNDPQFVECHEALARRVLRELPAASDGDRAAFMVALCFARAPHREEMQGLAAFVAQERDAMVHSRRAANEVDLHVFTALAAVLMIAEEFVVRG